MDIVPFFFFVVLKWQQELQKSELIDCTRIYDFNIRPVIICLHLYGMYLILWALEDGFECLLTAAHSPDGNLLNYSNWRKWAKRRWHRSKEKDEEEKKIQLERTKNNGGFSVFCVIFQFQFGPILYRIRCIYKLNRLNAEVSSLRIIYDGMKCGEWTRKKKTREKSTPTFNEHERNKRESQLKIINKYKWTARWLWGKNSVLFQFVCMMMTHFFSSGLSKKLCWIKWAKKKSQSANRKHKSKRKDNKREKVWEKNYEKRLRVWMRKIRQSTH